MATPTLSTGPTTPTLSTGPTTLTGIIDHRAVVIRPALWLIALVGSQIAAISVDFFKVGLTNPESFDTGRWIVIAPGQIFFGLFLLLISPHVIRLLLNPANRILTAWFIWNLTTFYWSADPRQTLIQGIGAINLFLIAAWFTYMFGLARVTKVATITLSGLIAWGAYWQWFGPGPGFDDRFEGMADGFNQQGILCAFALLCALIAGRQSENQKPWILLALALAPALAATGGRVPLVGTTLAAAIIFRRQLASPRHRGAIIASVVVGCAVLGYALTQFEIFQRGDADALNGRDVIWPYAVELARQSPIIGHGMMTGESIWKSAVVAGEIDFVAGSAHSMPLDTLVGGGAIGLGLLAAGLANLTRVLARSGFDVGVALMALLLTAGTTESLVHRPALAYVVLGILTAIAAQASNDWARSHNRYTTSPAPIPELGARVDPPDRADSRSRFRR